MFGNNTKCNSRFILVAACGLAATAMPAVAQTLAVEGHFQLDEEPNISGMDCAGMPGDPQRLCVLVDDELKTAQFAALFPDKLVVGDAIPLFANANPPILGTRPGGEMIKCSRGEDPGEMDGEGVARDGPLFYIAGSHGCSSKGKFRPETFVLARVKTQDGSAPSVERTYRLSEALLAAPDIEAHFARDLDDGGLSIEGIAARDGRLVLAARVPSVQVSGTASGLLISVDVDALFDAGGSAAVPAASVTFLPLGDDTGFRDLEALTDGRFLALTGPAADGAGVFQLRLLDRDLRPLGEPVTIETPAGTPGSPEAVEWLGDREGEHKVMVLSDGAPDGGPFIVSFSD